MKRKVGSTISLIVLLCCLLCGTIYAEDSNLNLVDGSYLTAQDSSTGKSSDSLTRGQHLMEGESSVTKAGTGRIYVYGSTTANHKVNYVAVIVYVDQYNEKTDSWDQIGTWTVEDNDTYFVSYGKSMKVDRGYYYRVHCDHFAGNEDPYDQTYSFTDGIWIP